MRKIEDEVRIYNELFFSDTQPARLLHLRKLALHMMEELTQFSALPDRRSVKWYRRRAFRYSLAIIRRKSRKKSKFSC